MGKGVGTVHCAFLPAAEAVVVVESVLLLHMVVVVGVVEMRLDSCRLDQNFEVNASKNGDQASSKEYGLWVVKRGLTRQYLSRKEKNKSSCSSFPFSNRPSYCPIHQNVK